MVKKAKPKCTTLANNQAGGVGKNGKREATSGRVVVRRVGELIRVLREGVSE